MTSKSYQGGDALSRGTSWGKLLKGSFIQYIFCNLFLFPVRLLAWVFLHLEIETEIDLKKLEGPLIIASNHISWIDPFLIGIPFHFNAKILPIHYTVLDKFYYKPLILPFVWLVGSFPVKRKIGLDKALKIPIDILNKGGVIGIFPEGKREWKKGPSRPKRGIAYMALKTGTKILPIRIETPIIKMTFIGALLGKYKIKIKIGKPFYLPKKTIAKVQDYNQPANFVINRIRQL